MNSKRAKRILKTERIIKRRRDTIKRIWNGNSYQTWVGPVRGSDQELVLGLFHGKAEQHLRYREPGGLRKYNLDCGCGTCKSGHERYREERHSKENQKWMRDSNGEILPEM